MIFLQPGYVFPHILSNKTWIFLVEVLSPRIYISPAWCTARTLVFRALFGVTCNSSFSLTVRCEVRLECPVYVINMGLRDKTLAFSSVE